MNPQRALEKQALLAKAIIERQEMYMQWQSLKHSAQPESIKSELVQLGAEKITNALPNASSVFSALERYPYASLRIARTLLSASTSSNRFLKPIALGLASWFILKRFKNKR